MAYSVYHEPHAIIVSTPELELGFGRESGALILLRRPASGLNYLGHGVASTALDVRLSTGWMSQRTFPRYLSHQVKEEDGATLVSVRVGLGPLLLVDDYRVTGTLVARSLSIKHVGLDELQLLGVWLGLPGVRIGAAEACRFEAPGTTLRPRLALLAAAQLRRDQPPGPDLAPVLRHSRTFESSPDHSPGLLGVHSTTEQANLLCWYLSDQQPAWPTAEGSPGATSLTLGHEIALAGWLPGDASLAVGTQYFMLVQGSWQAALRALQQTWPLLGLRPVSDVPAWMRQAVIYETHPAFYGGFCGLADTLPRLRSLGVTVLLLLPIWCFDNRSDQLWDGNWISSGSPYAVVDFEGFDPLLGSGEDFRALVARAHQLGMHLLLDLVTQGCALSSRYVREQPGWFCRDERGRLVSSHGWLDTYSFDWAQPAFQQYMLRWSLRLVEDYGIDGFRISAAGHKEPNWDRRLGRPASSTSFGILRLLDQLRQELKALRPEAALLGDMAGPIYVSRHDAAIDQLAHFMFYQAGLGRISAFELGRWLQDALLTQPSPQVRICLTESHETRDINPLADALRGSRLSRLLLAAMVACGYVPLLWHGQEQDQEHFLRQLLQLPREHAVLRSGELLLNAVPCDVPQIFPVLRRLERQLLLALFNIGPHKRLATLSLPVDRLPLEHEEYHLRDLISGQPWQEQDRRSWRRDELLRLALSIEPFGYAFLALLPGPAPDERRPQPQPRHLGRLQRPRWRRRPGRRFHIRDLLH